MTQRQHRDGRSAAVVNGSVPDTTYRAYPSVEPRATEGTLGRRLFAYLIDIVVIAIITAVLWVVIGILGVITLGLGWLLFSLLPLTAIIYNAITVSGASQGTVGMRMTGVRVLDATTGGRVSFVAAAVHALLFYVALASAALLWIADVAFGLFRDDRRLARDLLTNVVFVRAS
jgi:uncharacterized RDD family membrane protein YckC